MLLTGTYERVLDDKNRLAFPKRVREILDAAGEKNVFLTPGSEGSIAIYPEASFEALANRLSASSPTSEEVLRFSRLFYGQAHSTELDGQGRIRVPVELMGKFADRKNVVLVGVRDHLELWDRTSWSNYLAQHSLPSG